MANPDEHPYDVFVSYAQADREWVEGYLLDALIQVGLRCHSEAAFALGAPRLLEFERAVQRSRRTLLVLSPAYLADGSGQLVDLLAQSYDLQTESWRAIPLILHPASLPPRLAMLTALDATEQDDWCRVIEHLCIELKCPAPGPSSKPSCPYPGMMPFDEADGTRFYGRDREIRDLLELLRLHPLLTVIGPSGSGKSSLIFAGLIPALRGSGLFGPGDWLVRRMRPGRQPLSTLNEAVGDVVDIRTWNRISNHRLLLVVDQLEELFAVSREEVADQGQVVPFQHAVLRLADAPGCSVLLTVRADFYPDLMGSPLWQAVQAHRYEVLPLGEEGLRQAVARPAEDVGVCIEPLLVEQLVADAANEPGALPMVQEALVLMWEHLERHFLSRRVYSALGSDGRTGLQCAMAHRADAALSGLSLNRQVIARRIILRLIQFGEGRADTRRQQPVAALRSTKESTEEFDCSLEHLARCRLLTLGGEAQGKERVVDIAHEALITGWPALQEWLKESRQNELMRRRLESKAAEWERLQRQGGLLDEVELREAQRWLESSDAAELGYSQVLAELMLESQAIIDEKKRREAKAHQHELEAARKLADEQRLRAEEGERSAKRLRQRFRLIAALGLAAVLAAVLAVGFGIAAEANRVVALGNEARAWTELARQQLQIDPVASLYLSTRALPSAQSPRPYVPEAEFVLRMALQTSSERQYQRVSESLEQNQISLEGPRVATGGDGLHLINHDLTGDPTELEKPGQQVKGVAWRDDGVLLSHGSSDVSLWQDDKRIAMHDFGSPIACALWRPRQREVAVCSGSRLWVWSDELLQPTRVYTFPVAFNPAGLLPPAAWSPDGRWLAAWDADNALLVWDAQSRETALIADRAPGNRIWEATWSPDNRHLLAINADGTVRVWTSGVEPTLVLSTTVGQGLTPASELAGAAFVDAGRFLTWGFGGKADLRSLDGTLIDTFDPRAGRMHGIKLLAEAGVLLTFMDNGSFFLWDLATGAKKEFTGHTGWVVSADWNGTYLATGAVDGTVRIWDPAGGDALMTLHGHISPTTDLTRADVVAVRWQKDGRLLTGGLDGSLRVWQVLDDNGVPLCSGSDREGYARCHGEARTLPGKVGEIQDPRWLGNDTILASSEEGVGYRWNLRSGVEHAPGASGERMRHFLWSPDGERFLTYDSQQPGGSQPQAGLIWQTDTGQPATAVSAPIDVAFWLEEGLLVGVAGAPPRLVDPATGRTLAVLREQQGEVTDAQASGKQLATADIDGMIRIWDTESGRLLGELKQSAGGFAPRLQWSADGRYLLGAGSEVVLWDVKDQKGVPISREAGQSVRAKFSPDGCYVAGGIDSTVYVWDAKTRKQLWSSPAHGNQLHGVQWLSGARWDGPGSRLLLLSWAGDGTARVWDWKSDAEILRLADKGSIRFAAANADGSMILTANSNGTLLAWNTWLNDPAKLLQTTKEHTTRPVEGTPAALRGNSTIVP